ncbi:MAG TPA: hypothetical protein VHH34_17050 [Pseudonocardiaceae bacterium]|nr:hypothetical protein [Pseudonocardiaceae bacterium]
MATTILSEHRVLIDVPLPALNGANATEATATFSLPADFIDTDLVDLPVLSFRVDTADDGATPLDGLVIELRSSSTNDFAVPGTNNQLEATCTFNSNVAQTLHEVINSGSLDSAVATNAFQFAITGGTGQATISDIVLLVKREVTGPVNTMTGSGVGGD